MNKKVVSISSAVVMGATSRGLTGLIPMSGFAKIAMHLAIAGAGGYVAFTTNGNSTKSAIIGGGGLGVAVVQGLEAVKGVFSLESVASKINPESKWGQFLQKASGLSGAQGGLNGYFDELGNYHEDGLGGYIDPAGNYVQEDGLAMYEEDGLGLYEEDGLGLYDDEDGLAIYDEDGLGLYDDEDGLAIYEDTDEGENFSY